MKHNTYTLALAMNYAAAMEACAAYVAVKAPAVLDPKSAACEYVATVLTAIAIIGLPVLAKILLDPSF